VRASSTDLSGIIILRKMVRLYQCLFLYAYSTLFVPPLESQCSHAGTLMFRRWNVDVPVLER